MIVVTEINEVALNRHNRPSSKWACKLRLAWTDSLSLVIESLRPQSQTRSITSLAARRASLLGKPNYPALPFRPDWPNRRTQLRLMGSKLAR